MGVTIMKKLILGIDLGGTKIATILADAEGNIENRVELKTEAEKGPQTVIDNVLKSVDGVIDNTDRQNILGIGIGSPGPLDQESGVVLSAGNLGWKNVPIKDILEKRYGLNAYLENDANAAALAEYAFGAGRGSKNLLYITVSTGVGGGIIIDGKVYSGSHGMAGEIGHITIDPQGPPCNCGNNGCLEVFASGTGLVRRTREAIMQGAETSIMAMVDGDLNKITALTVEKAALSGDAFSKEMWDSTGDYLGIGLASLINVLDPELLVMGGGVSKAGELLFAPMRKTISKRLFQGVAYQVKIVRAELGKDVGTLGAVAVALNRQKIV